LFAQILVIGAIFCVGAILWSLLQSERTKKLAEMLRAALKD